MNQGTFAVILTASTGRRRSMCAAASSALREWTSLPFLYPSLLRSCTTSSRSSLRLLPRQARSFTRSCTRPIDAGSTTETDRSLNFEEDPNLSPLPTPSEYSETPFIDRARITITSGGGGHGCISFLRDKYIEDGPPNGGDGGTGGSVFIQAVRSESSLHRLARRPFIRAPKGANGQGQYKGGQRGEDVIIEVPVGTVVKEVSREDPVDEEHRLFRLECRNKKARDKELRREKEAKRQEELHLKREREERGEVDEEIDDAEEEEEEGGRWKRKKREPPPEIDINDPAYIRAKEKWLFYPGGLPNWMTSEDYPDLPPPRRPMFATLQPEAPIHLDLSTPQAQPQLLVSGAIGGHGNPHFLSSAHYKPKFATRGSLGATVTLELELKLLADVGLVGLPNAGKSTLLRGLTSSRARVGDWAFTTLAPNVGTVVLDDFKSSPTRRKLTVKATGEQRTNFTIADIPGLIAGASQDKGLGLGFLRHIERARVLAFVVDLSKGDPVDALRGLWKELRAYEMLRQPGRVAVAEILGGDGMPVVLEAQDPDEQDGFEELQGVGMPPQDLEASQISRKPWFVVAGKADVEDTRASFAQLAAYLKGLRGPPDAQSLVGAWQGEVRAIPVSALRKEGMERVIDRMIDLLE